MIKILFSDLDGTLLEKGCGRTTVEISPRNREAITRFVNNGGQFAVATGRNYLYNIMVYDSLGVEMQNMISCNGATLLVNGKKVYRMMKPESFTRLVNFFYQHGDKTEIRMFGVFEDNTYVADYLDEEFERRYVGKYKTSNEITLKEVAEHPENYPGIQKTMLAILNGKNQYYYDLFKKEFINELDVGWPIPVQVEFMGLGVNKGSAIDLFKEALNLKEDEIAVVGDADNDIPMLVKTPYRFVMESGEESTKALAYRTVKDVAECIEIIEEINGK